MNRAVQGMTLIEVLVAIVLFLIISTAVLNLLPQVFRTNGQSRAEQGVTIGAKAYMEGVRTTFGTQAGFDAPVLPANPAASNVGGYTCTGAVSNQQTNAAGVTIIKRVTLTCTQASQRDMTFTLDFGRPAAP